MPTQNTPGVQTRNIHIVQEGENEILEFKVDWSRFFDGIDLSTNNFTHTADNPTLADAISNNGVNVLQVQ